MTSDTRGGALGADPAVGRRRVLASAAGLATAVVAGRALAADPHAGHGHGDKVYTPGVRNKKRTALVKAAIDCTIKGDACLSHCMETFVAGDTTMGACADAVQQMLPVCRAMSQLGAYDSKHLPDLARVCIGVCTDCEKVCREHAEHQKECKDCADACAALIEECKKLAA
ncbi:MAG: four-helix bundle copper-binding protein [Deltaproteobacteria bacterium]|nr:four-helix bundle copper-binding protein [Deltaproteobacteria bacterium]